MIDKAWNSFKTTDIHYNNHLLSNINADHGGVMSPSENTFFMEKGVGINRFNEITLSAITNSFIKSIIKKNNSSKKISILIGYDSEINSDIYVDAITRVFNKHKIKVYALNKNTITLPQTTYIIKKMKLDGAINIADSNLKNNFAGLFLFDKTGTRLSKNNIDKIKNNIDYENLFKLDKTTKLIVEYLPNGICEEYYGKLKSTVNKDISNIKFSMISPSNNVVNTVSNVFQKISSNNVIKAQEKKELKNIKKYFNFDDAKAYENVLKAAKKSKSDIGFILDASCSKIGFVVKHQKRYKYITSDQMAAIFLEHKLSNINSIKKDSFIVKTTITTDLVDKIAKKYGVKVVNANPGFNSVLGVIKKTKGNLIFAFDREYQMLVDPSLMLESDSILSMIQIVNIASDLKKDGMDIYEKLKSLYKEYGVYRNTVLIKKITCSQSNNLMKRILNLKEVGGRKVINVLEVRGINKLRQYIKVFLEDGSWIVVWKYSNEITNIYIQNVGAKELTLMDIVYRDQEVENVINDNLETFDNKKFTWKSFLKYLIFLLIIGGILTFVFLKVYPQTSNGVSLWESVKLIFIKSNGVSWAGILISYFSMGLLSTWMRKRLLSFQGEKVAFKHLFISSYMGIIISYVTPFVIGGDAIGYWYLRRKGVKRGPLLASFITSTIIWQFGTILQSSVYIPFGLPVYKLVFNSENPEAKAAFSLFIINLSWDIFATFMIMSLSFSRRFQEFIVRNAIKVLEWMPFITLKDAGAKAASYQYEFREMRIGMKKLWKNKLIISEVLVYELIPKVLSLSAIWNIHLGIVRNDLELGQYWSQVIANDLIGTANSISITPGGSGTGEWLNITVNKMLFKPIEQNGTSSMTASALNVAFKFIWEWPKLIVSSLLILTIIMGENRRAIYLQKAKNSRLSKIEIKKLDTSFYKKAMFPWILILSGWLIAVILINHI